MADGFSEKESQGWDASVETLAHLALLSAGAYAGVKHFPSITLKRAINRLSSQMLGARGRTAGLLGSAHRMFGKTLVDSPSWKHPRPQDLTLLHEIKTAIDVFKAESRISGGSVDAVTRSLMSRYASDVPQAMGSYTPLTVRQFLKHGTGIEQLRKNVGGEALDQMRDSIKQLVRLPGFRQSLARQGITEAQFMGRVPVGAFMMNTPEGVIGTRGGLRSLLEDVAGIRIPFTGFKPFSLLIPDLTPKPGMTFLGPTASKAMFKSKDALFVEGAVYPLSAAPSGLLLGRPEVGYRLASARQIGAARAAASRMGIIRPVRGEGTRAERLQRTRQLPRWRRRLNILSRRYGVGPQWAGRRSVPESVYHRLRAIAKGETPAFPEPTGAPAAGVTAEGAWLRELTKRPTGAVKNLQDLSLMERIRLKLGGRVNRAFYRDGQFVSETVAHLGGVPSAKKVLPAAFGYRAGEAVGHYATKGFGRTSDWLNYQIMRPLWLMSEMTGLGMRPGKSPMGSLGQIGLKIALPAYVGYQALEYAEYKMNRWFGWGPITGPAYLYTQARIGAQTALDAIGVTDMLQDMEEQYPGSIDSPASKGVRAAASVFGGAYLARKIAHPYAKMAAVAGGAALGWMQVAGINAPADELTRIYSGEQDVPVRAGRGWVLGRRSFAGNKIKYFQPHWYQRLQARPKDISLYGSRQEAWRKSWLPTPENWGLLKNVYDPYFLDRAHWYNRPYPQTSGLGSGIPIVGPIAERTVGRLIKPIQRREIPVGADSSTPSYQDMEQAITLGLGPPVPRTEGRVASRIEMMTGETIYRMFDWTGLPGFMIGAIREQLTGKTGWYLDQKALATSAEMTSPSRDYYDRNLGGMLGACFVAGTKVPTAAGRKPIEDILTDDLVVSGDGQLRRVTGTLKRKSSDLIRLKVANLSVEIVGTSTHHIPVYRFYPCHDRNIRSCVPGARKHCARCTKEHKEITTEDVDLGSIKPGDWVCTPIRPFGEDRIIVDLSKFTSRACVGDWIYNRASVAYAQIYDILFKKPDTTRAHLREMGFGDLDAKEALYIFRHMKPLRFQRYVTITPEIAYVLGWWVAEGSIEDSGRVTFTMGDQDLPYVPEIQATIKSVFGADALLTPTAGKGFALRAQCIPLMLLVGSLFGRGAENKFVPEHVKQMPREELLAFFRGVVLGGGRSNPGQGGYTSASGDLCRDIFDIGLMFNLVGSLNIDYEEKPNGNYPQGTPRKDTVRSYIQWSGSAGALYMILHGVYVPPKKHQVRSFIHDGLYFVKVLECEPVPFEKVDVYDLQIEDMHYYVAEHVLVHNTEFMRRFVPRDQQYYRTNPLANTTPNWLPGNKSAFHGDREHYMDLHTGDAFCVSGDTLIDVGYNLKRADAVLLSDHVRTHTGRILPVRAIAKRAVRPDERCYHIVFQGLTAFPSVFSEEHPLRQLKTVGRGKKPRHVWAEAQDIKPGDRIVCPLPRSGEGPTTMDLGQYITDRAVTPEWIYARKTQNQANMYEFLDAQRAAPRRLRWGERRDLLSLHHWDALEYEHQQDALRYDKDPERVSRHQEVTPHFAYMVGLYAAEGDANEDGRVTFSLHEFEQELREHADEGMKSICTAVRGSDVGTWYQGVGHGGDHYFGSIIAGQILTSMCGKYSENKRLPAFVFDLSMGLTRQVLRGLLSGDGSYFVSNGRTRLGLTTISRTLAYQTWLLLARLGYRSTISSWTPPPGQIAKSKRYAVNVNGARGRRLAHDLGFESDQTPVRRQAYKIFRDNCIVLKVQSVEETECDEVYGFEVDEDNSFCVAGAATHNTKMEKGEMRLPGPGWESVRRGVENKTPGMYSALDRYQIASDIAPHSQAAKHYRRMVQGQVHTGLLAKQDIDRFVRIQDQVAEQTKSRVGSGGYKYGKAAFRDQEVTIADTGLTTFTTHEHPGMRFHLAGVEGRTYALEGTADEYGKLRRRMAELQGKTISMTYGGFGPTTPAILGDTNAWAMDVGLGKRKMVGDLDFRAKHGTNMMRQGYEWMIHTTLPAFLNYPRSKWIGQMSPTEEYESFVERGTFDTGWEQPIQNYILPWFNQAAGTTSSAQLETRRMNEYVDNFKFAKFRRLEERALAMGDMMSANQFAREAGQTMVAANPYAPDFYRNIFGALPPSERPYFAAFAGVTSEARQERILNAVPESLKPTYIGVWDRQAGTAGFNSPVLQRYAEEARKRFEERPGERVAEYFAHQPLPDASHAQWHPAVDMDTVRIKIAEQQALDVHEAGMWERQRVEAEAYDFPAPEEAGEMMSQEDLYRILRIHGYENVHMMQGFPGANQFTFRRSRMQRWRGVYDNMQMQGAVA